MDIGFTKLSKSVSQFAFNFEMTVILNNDSKHERVNVDLFNILHKLKLIEPLGLNYKRKTKINV